ncbi:Mitochondrial tumor suppressor 1-like protein [Camponotus floridanus]|uniref:Mitochondrial tumor suppressor 1-like protein n=2 Tax=Camponotus floridanus TaxID=104421 RepID=E2AJC2_CAMFO|nr:Mitochondrial tumor suppressor 1-like protein [Camponotus floridanus]
MLYTWTAQTRIDNPDIGEFPSVPFSTRANTHATNNPPFVPRIRMHNRYQNVGESRIPVPRAARPSFFPKSRVLEASRLLSGSRRSTIFSGCFQFVNTEDESPTPREKFSGFTTSSPNIKTDSAADQTFAISPGWDIDKNDVQQLVHLSEEKSSLFRLLEDSQLSMIEDVGDTCLVESGLSNYNDANATPHYLMLNKQNSFEHDESLGILTPDQMTDFTVALECSRTPSCENLTGSAGSKLALTRASASTRPLVDVEPAEEGCSERTPSPEELPLDPKPVEPIRGSTVPVSFVTSVTSITSLEAGYQGDGENSRPASRGADPPSMAVPPVNLPAPCRQDPMTDSDFFTESDADAHEEIVRGDRKAQVIDGTLFCAPGERVCPSFTGEEMDSSGIYSDLDKLQAPGEQASEENDDHTPDTGDTELSQRSQPTPVVANVIMDYLQIPIKSSDETISINDTTASVEVMAIEKVENNENIRPKPQSKADSVPLKKYKMPKRNVVSKIKAMIESSSKDDAEKEARRSQRSTRKGGRWDAVMNKIEAGKNEQRTRPARKEVKSRVLQNLTLSPAARPMSKKAGDANNNNNKDKRRTRGWQEMKSPTQETARSSVRSSMSDLSSGPSKDIPKRSPTSTNPPRRFVSNGHTNHHQVRVNSFDAKKNCIDVTTVELEKSPPSARKPAITRRLAANATVKQKSSVPSIKDRESKETHHNSTFTVRTSPETRDQAAQTTVPYEDFRAERAAQALAVSVHYLAFELDAFATPQLKKDFEKLKIDCEKMKNERSTVLSEIDGLRARCVNLEERLEAEREDHSKDLDQLRDELETHRAKQVAALVETLKEERRKYDVRLEEITREHRATIAKLRTEHVNELGRKEEMRRSVVHDHGAALMAEIESLRSVLELKSQENTALRSELDSYRRDIEEKDALQIRLDMAEARCEDLKAQLQRKESFERQVSHENEMLHESIHQVSKHNKRLSQRNEELQWKLRNKNDWVSVLANQLNPRLTRSTGAEQMEHNFSAEKNGAHSSSMMKFMVEKGASVSWTLEIDDLSKGSSSDSLSTKINRSEGATTVSRQGSLRLSNRAPMDTRARSKSVSTTCESARAAAMEEAAAWSPTLSSTPISRRRPRKDQSSPCSSSSSSSSTSSAAPTVNPAVAAAVAAAAAAVDECSIGGGQRPQEAGGEAMISEETSASSSEDESSTGSDIPRLGMQFAWGKPIK